MYHVDETDAHNYDLMIDTNSLGLAMAAELIVRAVEFGRPTVRALPFPFNARHDEHSDYDAE